MGKLEVYLSILALIATAVSASRCPESRKPHPTSCTIFYNCVNLPGGGYVWAPAKCTNGLVFQPYLRICVLPGDSWTCDTLATEAPETTTSKIPELIDSTQTSYLGYSEDGSAGFSEPMDYYKVEKYTEPADSPQQTVTPYPLIEATQPNNYVNQIDSTIKNLGLPIAVKHSEDNYLYHFVNGQQTLAAPVNPNNEQLQAHLERLTQLVERLVAYQGFGLPRDRQPPTTVTMSSTSQTPPGFDTSYSNDNFYKGYSNGNQDSAVLSFLIKNYVLKPQAQGTKSVSEQGVLRDTSFGDQETTTAAADAFEAAINGPQAADNIVMIRDGLNNRQYFTIHKYKSIADQLTTERVELLACTSGVRLHNSTDCTKYYSCEPSTAKIRQYSCPSNTAFNKHKRLCERDEYVRCVIEAGESTQRSSYSTILARDSESSETNPCETMGKHPDPTSSVHYYLCYSDKGKSTDLKYQRMACPNSLVFCQGKNVCTTKKRCETL